MSQLGWKGGEPAFVSSRRRLGFTLIELLVVIAIISLLVSILVPSLQKAKELARKVVCLTRFQSIGTAYGLYLAEFDKGPVGYARDGEHYRTYPYEGWSDYPEKDADGHEINPYKPYFGWYKGRTTDDYDDPCWALGEYLGVTSDRKTIEATCCPNWFDWFIATAADGGLLNTSAPTSYAVNWYLGCDTHLGDHIVKSTASTPMLMDGMGENFESDGKLQPYYTVFPKVNFPNGNKDSDLEFTSMSETTHDGSANYLFFDGHAENHPATKDPNESLEYFNNLWTWYGD
ncbi:MAG: prepilin-type N-terminal cleavage/methylation domain-containing protein [Phycisphaerae bacterium]|nr:prepilin-type N-terminal cleavage/methylation domain-containing protein [Phycisphaerae bacterium]